MMDVRQMRFRVRMTKLPTETTAPPCVFIFIFIFLPLLILGLASLECEIG
jgi:hypothetical protein